MDVLRIGALTRKWTNTLTAQLAKLSKTGISVAAYRLHRTVIAKNTAQKHCAPNTVNTKSTGQRAESAALRYIKQQGLSQVETNYTCSLGEIDIIALDGKTLVFIEVRYRKYSSYGGGAMTVTRKKQQKLIKTAKLYLQQHRANVECRFDVIEMSPAAASRIDSKSVNHCEHALPNRELFHFNWIKNAFM